MALCRCMAVSLRSCSATVSDLGILGGALIRRLTESLDPHWVTFLWKLPCLWEILRNFGLSEGPFVRRHSIRIREHLDSGVSSGFRV